MRIFSAFILVTALMAVPSVAQGFGDECNPVGTWFGGSDSSSSKYLLNIQAGPAGRYTVTYHLGFIPIPAIPRISSYVGEMVKTNNKFVVYSLALANFSPVPALLGGPPPNIFAVRAQMEFEECNTLKSTIDFIGVYSWGDKVPFLDLPDNSASLGTESYRRMPTTCAVGVCPE
jgi:hypothetical protein